MNLIINKKVFAREDAFMEIQRIENMCGGNGHVFLKPILNEKQLMENVVFMQR